MDADVEKVTTEVRSWLADNWDPDLTVGEWWEILAGSGWGAPTWPEEWHGRGLNRGLMGAVGDEFAKAGALGPPAGLGMLLAAPTILTHGSDEHKKRYLWPIVTGKEAWCQLFSEPGAGSDLASLQCKAVRDGEEWIVNGQKVWTSGGQIADVGMLIARTDVNAPKHQGITYFALPMLQDGVEVRPLVEMTGRALFSEVFFSDARVADDAVIGGLGNGWAVANTTLAAERAGLGAGGGGATSSAMPGSKAGALEQRAGDFVKISKGNAMGQMAGRTGRMLMELAKAKGRQDDPVLRQDLMRLHTLNELGRMNVARQKAGYPRSGGEANIMKLMMSEQVRLTRDIGLSILGPAGTLWGKDAETGGLLQEMAVFSPGPSIYGGSDQIQRNIIGERVLGLPKEPGPSKDTPFKDLLVGTQDTGADGR